MIPVVLGRRRGVGEEGRVGKSQEGPVLSESFFTPRIKTGERKNGKTRGEERIGLCATSAETTPKVTVTGKTTSRNILRCQSHLNRSGWLKN